VKAQEDRSQSPALRRYFAQIRGLPALTLDSELTLARRARAGSAAAADELIRANLGIVVQEAKRYRNLGIPFEDLLAEGNLGLVEAARRFDPERGHKFITYAIWWIRRAILKALNEQTTIVRVSYHQKRRLREIRRVERRLTLAFGRTPDRQELSTDMAETLEQVERVLRLGTHRVSLDEPLGKDPGDSSLVETLPCPAESSAERDMIRREMDRRLANAIERLTPKERQVVEGRFGLSGEACATLKEIGERMNLSRERVRQIEAEARRSLRRAFGRGSRRAASSPRRAAVGA
jgi:RNA polymerase sigma factor (sigma-70 family)